MRSLSGVIFVVVLLFTWDALAEPRVALVVPDEPTEPSTRAEERLRAELMAAGYEVVTVPVDGLVDRTRMRAIAKRTTSQAAVSVQVGHDAIEGAVWAKDAATGQESMDQVRSTQATLEGAAVFAIWAAEQLRASVLSFEREARPAAPTPPSPPPAQPTEPKREPAPLQTLPPSTVQPSYSLSGGVAALFGPGGVPAGLGPFLTLSWHTDPWFGSLRFIGPVSSSLDTTSGSVDVDQEQLLARVGVDLGGAARRLVPFVAFGLGAHRLGVRGNALPPYQSTSNQGWSGVFQLTGGLRLRLSDLFFVAGEGGAWVASSRPVIRIAGAPDAHIGRPGYVGSMGIGVSW